MSKVEDDTRPSIMLVDDLPENLYSLAAILSKFDINIVKVSSGKEAIELTLKQSFFLILMDVQMPEMSGPETALIIKSNVKTSFIPIIFVTAVSGEQSDIFSGYEAGAVDYILKPINPTIMRNKVNVFLDIYKQQRDIERTKIAFEHRALHDELTGLANRSQFEIDIDKSISNASRHELLVALLYIDLDNFKPVNDSYGHHVGDEVLVQVAQRFHSCLRNGDHIARLGGDEFAVILNTIKEPSHAGLVAQKIIDSLLLPYLIEGVEIRIGVSIGISCFPGDGSVKEEIKRLADASMYRAKENGKSQYFFSGVEAG